LRPANAPCLQGKCVLHGISNDILVADGVVALTGLYGAPRVNSGFPREPSAACLAGHKHMPSAANFGRGLICADLRGFDLPTRPVGRICAEEKFDKFQKHEKGDGF